MEKQLSWTLFQTQEWVDRTLYYYKLPQYNIASIDVIPRNDIKCPLCNNYGNYMFFIELQTIQYCGTCNEFWTVLSEYKNRS